MVEQIKILKNQSQYDGGFIDVHFRIGQIHPVHPNLTFFPVRLAD
jgi:hypothetical protein